MLEGLLCNHCNHIVDRLLDMGFRDALKEIISYMPRQHEAGGRQTLLFSATFPVSLKSMTELAVKSDHKFIDTLDEDEADANVQVLQKSLVVPLQHHVMAMQQVLQQHIQECQSNGKSYKIIVFFTTARIAGFMAELFSAMYPQYSAKNLWEIHSRKSQSHRMKVAKQFTEGSNCLLFSSDVSARGVDYPNVSFVLQVGAPSEKAQYIHRLGRTARAGNAGTGVLLLCDFERAFLKEVEDLDITTLETQTIKDTHFEAEECAMQHLIQTNDNLKSSAGSAYQAFMGYYNSNVKRLRLQNKHEMVKISNEYATMLGFPENEPPALLAKTVGKMGLKGVPGIRIDREGGAGRGNAGRGGGRGRGAGRGGRGR
jgi:ATP-dependent RNA helicase MSS116